MKKNDRVKILRPGRYKGESGVVQEINRMMDGGVIVEVKLEIDLLYDPTETILVWENEVEVIN